MGDHHHFPKELGATPRHYLRGYSRQITIALLIFGIEQQRHQSRTAFPNRQAELLRQFISKSGSADFGDRKSAGGHHQRRG